MRAAATFLIACAAAASWPAERLGAEAFALKDAVTLNGPWIKAGDVLEGAPPRKLAEVKLKRLGLPGTATGISRDFVMLKAREARLGSFTAVSGAAFCLVSASARTVKGSDLSAFAQKYLRERLAPLSGSAEIEISLKDAPKDLTVPDRAVRLEIPPSSGGRFRGNVLLRVLARQSTEDGAEIEVGQASLSCLVKVRQNVVTALRPIRRGEAVDSGNAALVMTDTTFAAEDGYASLGELSGLKAKTYIGQGKVIAPAMLERPPAVRRGDVVKLVVRSGMVSVQVSAKALRDAALGDSIPVEITESKKQVQARVLDGGTVVSESR